MATKSNATWGRRTRMPAEKRREQLLDAAAEIIISDGFDNLTMEAITDRAGVSKALGYSYFNRLDDLFHELFDREFSVVYERLAPAIAAPGSLEERITNKVHAYFEVIAERHDLFLVLNRNLNGPTYRSERRERHSRWEAWVADLIVNEFQAPDRVARAVARLLMAIDDRCVQMWTRSGFPRDDMEKLCVQFQLAGLRAILEPRAQGEQADEGEAGDTPGGESGTAAGNGNGNGRPAGAPSD
jgi:AcrR family transcriptional regulator